MFDIETADILLTLTLHVHLFVLRIYLTHSNSLCITKSCWSALFNIYIRNILELFELNKAKDKGALAFADDLIVYTSGKKPSEINQKLEILVDKIHFFLRHTEIKNQHQ